MKFIEDPKIEHTYYPVGEYMNHNLSVFKQMVKTFNGIRQFHSKKIVLICRGSSGAIAATVFSSKIQRENKICHIKKEGESSNHSNSCLFFREDPGTVHVIVDDFIITGETMNEIYRIVCEQAKTAYGNFKIDCVAVSGNSTHSKLDFTPDYFICSRRKAS